MIPYIIENDLNYQLDDAITCIVTEERNGKFELKMTCDVTGNNADKIQNYAEIWAKPNDDDSDQPFEIYRIAKTINGRFTVYAQHRSYKLSGIPVSAFSVTGTAQEALNALKSHALTTCGFTFSTDKTTAGTFDVKNPVSLRSMLMGIQGSILQIFGGGEYKFDENSVTLMASRGKRTDASIIYGKNLTGITYDDNMSTVYNGVVPYWRGMVQDETTGEDVDTLVALTTDPVVYTSNHESFPRNNIRILDLSDEFKEPPTEAQLRSRAETFITENSVGSPDVSISVNFFPIWQAVGLEHLKELEKISLCDTVSVIVPKLNIATTAQVIETQYNVLKERYDSMKIGTVKKNLIGKIKGDFADIENVIKQLRRN